MNGVSGMYRSVSERLSSVPGTIKKTAAKTGDSIIKTFESLNTAVTQLKGLQAFAKAGRSIEGAMKQIIGSTSGLGVGWANTLKGISATSAALSALNAIVTLPEQIKKLREIIEVSQRVFRGDYVDLTVTRVLDHLSFWPKKAAEYIECISFVGNNLAFYNLGVAATPLATTKSFADGFSSITGIAGKSLAIHNARKQSAHAKAMVTKWEGRGEWVKGGTPKGWTRPGLDKLIAKEILSAHLAFTNEALRLGKEFKIDAKVMLPVNVQKEEIKTTIFNHKIQKIVEKERKPEVSRQEDLKHKLKHVEAKLWKSDLLPESRNAILNVLRDKDLTPEEKVAKLQSRYLLKYRISGVAEGECSTFGTYNPENHQVDLVTRSIFEQYQDKKSTGLSYDNVLTDALKSHERWDAFRCKVEGQNPFDDPDTKKALTTFCNKKVEQWKEFDGKQRKIITKSAISIAFSAGILALVVLGLTLTFAHGSLPAVVVKHLPFALAGLGVAVSVIGLVKFFVEEVNKDDKPVRKPKISQFDIYVDPSTIEFAPMKLKMEKRKREIDALRDPSSKRVAAT